MSYARHSKESDVYVFLAVGGHLECCGCLLGEKEVFRSTRAMVTHLRKHIRAGHAVPARVIVRLQEDQRKNDAFIEEERRKRVRDLQSPVAPAQAARTLQEES